MNKYEQLMLAQILMIKRHDKDSNTEEFLKSCEELGSFDSLDNKEEFKEVLRKGLYIIDNNLEEYK